MNTRFLVVAALAAITVTQSARADRSRFWDYYDPKPTNYIGSQEWWEQGDAFSGDWWGVRNLIEDRGVSFSLTYTNNIAGNVVGGKQRSATYTDNIGFGIEFDFEKLIGWNGATFTVSALNRSGQSLSQIAIGNQFTVQQVYGNQTIMYYALAFEQQLLDDRLSIKIGRMAAGDEFASSPFYWLYMNNGIDGNPQSLPVNTQFSTYPSATWGARLRIDPTPEFNAMAGVYQTSPRYGFRSDHGLNMGFTDEDGVILISQVGWTPELFKREVPVDTAPTADAKSTVDGKSDAKSFKESVPGEMKGLPGHYWFGAYFSPWDYAQFGSTETATNSYGFYWHADQMVFQESPGSDQGLTLWSAVVLSPQQNIAKLPFQVNGGMTYQGLIPTREADQTIFGVVYGQFSDDYAAVTEATAGGHPDYELVFEWGYRVQLSKFLYVQPNVQYVINPGGAYNIPNALVLGAQCSVTF
jgi:porin